MSEVEDEGFQEALAVVEAEIKAFDDKVAAEATSQAEKATALYAALAQAFKFHRDWAGKPPYLHLLENKKVRATARGTKASPYIPTLKAFFDPSLDECSPTTDDEKKDKARRQKAISTYSAVLDYASHESAADVAEFIANEGGIETARVKWKEKRDAEPDAVERRRTASERREQQLKSGLAKLQKGMRTALPKMPEFKGTTQLAAIYFDNAGVAHYLGLAERDDSAKALLDKFLISHGDAPKTDVNSATATNAERNDLDKLLALLSVGAVAHPKDANVRIKNGKKGCEIQASHGSYDTCMFSATLPHQDFLPVGTYWFGANAIGCMKRLAILGKHGAKFTITGPSKIDGIDAAVEITITDYQAGIAAISAKTPDQPWDWRDVIPHTDIRRIAEKDGVATITYVSTVEKMARIKLINAWDAEAKVEGDFATWLQSTLGISKKDPNQRLVKAISDGTRKTTMFRITEKDWTVLDSKGDVTTHTFSSPIGAAGFVTEFVLGSKDILPAIDAVKALVDGGSTTIALVNKLMRVQCKKGSFMAEVFIPSIGTDGRHQAYTEFDSPFSQ
ncbi:hypothetical protein [Paramagnetospirillum magneticum]|uniref:Uncharacterized protein n=1 Tax=Paramagnetospirillum magneticum (strain ATCC 700264 / AMB-1) TaxID=342108 RepID=Q2W0P6_PARM1|nr:hypothetical protein [Paramagnetospirillum magneticum]BAE52579.1 hypothetical protein amb3775 [Paramagnetospirillum magneticum AMB-1]